MKPTPVAPSVTAPGFRAAAVSMASAQPHHQDDAVVLNETQKAVPPPRWKVLLHNDDYTTMEFVVFILMKHFHKSPPEATQIMLQVHHKGTGVAGVFPKDVAETKVALVTEEARDQDFPLLTTAEPE